MRWGVVIEVQIINYTPSTTAAPQSGVWGESEEVSPLFDIYSSSPWLSSWPLLGAAACQHNTPAHTNQLDGIVKLSWLSTWFNKCLSIVKSCLQNNCEWRISRSFVVGSRLLMDVSLRIFSGWLCVTMAGTDDSFSYLEIYHFSSPPPLNIMQLWENIFLLNHSPHSKYLNPPLTILTSS